ncbi:hypothetical protein K502DRAFT_340003 [Neoconidiobolus thromboides FSU 785]|nr:hypothetical protein K502DRAFT_340003 [Neoconidiobolus thromboides FSU 785]
MSVQLKPKQSTQVSHYSYDEDEDVPLSSIKATILPPNPEMRRNGAKHNVKASPNKIRNFQNGLQHAVSPPFQYQANHSDPSSNRSSSTYLGSGSHISSNRSSSTFQLNDPLLNIKTKSKSTFNLTSESNLDIKETTTKTSKKKGFSFFGLFKRNRKKDAAIEEHVTQSEPETIKDTRSAADIRAEEVKKMHDNEFAKLRRQREKEKTLSFYDMLPNNQQNMLPNTQQNIHPPRHAPSPQHSMNYSQMHYGNPPQQMINGNNHFSPPPPVPRIRSASTNNVSQYGQRPISQFSRGYHGGQYDLMQQNQRSSSYVSNHSPGFASSETLSTQYSRSIAPSPLIPHQSPGRNSYYHSPPVMGHKSQSYHHQKQPNYMNRI